METFLLALIGFSVFGAIVCFWGMWCNERTYRQRMAMLRAVPIESPLWDRYRDEFDAVTYNEHFWALFWFRDPALLYGPYSQALLVQQ